MKLILTVAAALIVLALAALFVHPIAASSFTGTISLSCDFCAVGEVVTLTGTGYKKAPRNTLTVIVWGSPEPADCALVGSRGDFTCTFSVAQPGWYNVVAYSNSRSVIDATSVLVQ